MGTAMGPDQNLIELCMTPEMVPVLDGFASTNLSEFRTAALTFSTAMYALDFKAPFQEE